MKMDPKFQNKVIEAWKSFQQGKLDDADELAQEALKLNSRSADALHLRGAIAGIRHEHSKAETLFRKAIEFEKRNSFIYYNLAKSLIEQNRFQESLKWSRKSIELEPGYDKTWLNYGKALFNIDDIERAISAFDRALSLNENLAEAYFNKANCLLRVRLNEEALALHDRALKLSPGLSDAWMGRGFSLGRLRRYDEALASHKKALELNPKSADVYNLLGVTYQDLRRTEEAVECYKSAISLRPEYSHAWINLGNALSDLGQYGDALSSYERALEIKPDGEFWLGYLIHTQMKVCDWTEIESRHSHLEAKLRRGDKASDPFTILGLFDSSELQEIAAKTYVNEKCGITKIFEDPTRRPRRKKIRLGYFSMDFREHPVARLIVELIEAHDRDIFEVYGFSFGVNTADSTRRRLEKAFDKFFDVEKLHENDIVRLSRELEIDIAIDLAGHTQKSRPGIFFQRAAPVQIGYLGFPGTWGSRAMDYFIGDKVAITEENRKFFSEKIIFLPHSFQANPSFRAVAQTKKSRADYGLPNRAFVYCCFNNSWKISPKIFGDWVEIIERVPGSVLWLYAENPFAAQNLVQHATESGISPGRLVVADRVPLEEYLARFEHADLFLDTLPYNGGTTASDALWTGLPVLTQAGASFSARMAASLLDNIGLPELITANREDYKKLAIDLAMNPSRLLSFKEKLKSSRLSAPIFSSTVFTKHIESAFQVVYDRYHAGLPPDHVYVKESV
jgi:predicted O-linked N-acetylglucosamine transferase (SPINDLY family)